MLKHHPIHTQLALRNRIFPAESLLRRFIPSALEQSSLLIVTVSTLRKFHSICISSDSVLTAIEIRFDTNRPASVDIQTPLVNLSAQPVIASVPPVHTPAVRRYRFCKSLCPFRFGTAFANHAGLILEPVTQDQSRILLDSTAQVNNNDSKPSVPTPATEEESGAPGKSTVASVPPRCASVSTIQRTAYTSRSHPAFARRQATPSASASSAFTFRRTSPVASSSAFARRQATPTASASSARVFPSSSANTLDNTLPSRLDPQTPAQAPPTPAQGQDRLSQALITEYLAMQNILTRHNLLPQSSLPVQASLLVIKSEQQTRPLKREADGSFENPRPASKRRSENAPLVDLISSDEDERTRPPRQPRSDRAQRPTRTTHRRAAPVESDSYDDDEDLSVALELQLGQTPG